MTTSLSDDEISALAEIAARMNGEAFEMDAESRPHEADATKRRPRYWPWEIGAFCVTSVDPSRPQRVVTFTRNAEDLCFYAVAIEAVP